MFEDEEGEGLSLSAAFMMVTAMVITMPLWLPVAVVFACGQEVYERVKRGRS